MGFGLKIVESRMCSLSLGSKSVLPSYFFETFNANLFELSTEEKTKDDTLEPVNESEEIKNKGVTV